jgi:hypothetical protein
MGREGGQTGNSKMYGKGIKRIKQGIKTFPADSPVVLFLPKQLTGLLYLQQSMEKNDGWLSFRP